MLRSELSFRSSTSTKPKRSAQFAYTRDDSRLELRSHVAWVSKHTHAAVAQTILNAASARACSVSHMGSCKVCVFWAGSNSAVTPAVASVVLTFTQGRCQQRSYWYYGHAFGFRGKRCTGLAQMLDRRSLFPQASPINGLC